MKILRIVLLLSIMVNAACDRQPVKPVDVTYADVTDAYYLGSVEWTGESGNNLVKITSSSLEGSPEVVEFLDGDGEILGEEFITVYVQDVVNISPRYTVLYGGFEFELDGGTIQSIGLLLDHTTGALYDLAEHYRPAPDNCYLGAKYHQQDRYGNIYFHWYGIERLVFLDPERVEVEYYLDYPGSYDRYFVDPDGNIYFRDGELLKLASGGIIETDASLPCFTGFQGDVFGFQTDTSKTPDLLRMTVDGSTLSKEVVLRANIYFDLSYDKQIFYFPDSAESSHMFISGFWLMKPGSPWEYLPYGFVFDEGGPAIYPFQIPDGLTEEVGFLGVEEHYIWIEDPLDQEKFHVLDLQDIQLNKQTGRSEFDSYTTFQLPDHLDIINIRFNEERIIEFRGYDLEKEVHVKGFLSMAHGLEYVEEESELGSVTLTRIK